ncbi:MAG: InlB B-repeat-containing protein, partial [Treponema sp.]|nr:InlB B-repeat-containing protein [Treponema sp.]
MAACSPSGGSPPQYTITFDSHGGSPVQAVTASEGAAVSKPADPTRTGYTFLGWFSAANGGTLYSWPHILTASLTMHAQWRAGGESQYTITFNSHGGSAVAAITAAAGTAVNEPAAPIRSGYTFLGWYSAESGGTRYSWPHALNADITMHAQWQAGEEPPPIQYTLTFYSNGGSAVEAVTAAAGTAVSEPAAPTLLGYAFTGWFSAASGGTRYSWPHTLNAYITMHAQWTVVSYSITYTLNGGTNAANPAAAYTVEDLPVSLAAPSRAGYSFEGWYDNGAFSGSAVTQIPAGSTGNKTFYAKWELVTYTITYNLNGGTGGGANPGSYTVEDLPLTLAAPSRAG